MASSKRNFSEGDIKLLWGLSAARCNHPDCRRECVAKATTQDAATARIGRIAHIVGSSDDGPRGDPTFLPVEKRDKYDNLILLCANHHDEVDGQPNTFTVQLLTQWKSDHESWVATSLQQSMAGLTFAELEDICQHIIATPGNPETDMTVTAPTEKMNKNGLTGSVRGLIEMGLARFDVVQAYLVSRIETDDRFPERLKAGFLAEYYDLIQTGLVGDGLFEGLRSFASKNDQEFKRSAAGLAVLCYLFQTCEVFDR